MSTTTGWEPHWQTAWEVLRPANPITTSSPIPMTSSVFSTLPPVVPMEPITPDYQTRVLHLMGMDRFPDALVADFRLFGHPCCGGSSVDDEDWSDSGCATPPSLPGGGHPIYNPRKDKCMWCKQRGHSLLFCKQRLEHCERMRDVNCCKGYHMPHLHDDVLIWRCQWCGTHMKNSYVKFNYPNTYAFEREKCLGNVERSRRKYGN